jgi:hypothetical protein
MAKAFWQKIAKGILIGGGTILSLFNPAVGAPLIVAGVGIKIAGADASTDMVSTYAANFEQAQNTAAAMAGAGNVSVLTNNIMVFIQKYFIYIIGAIAALVILPRLLPKRKRR